MSQTLSGVPPRIIARRYAVFVLTLAMAVATMGARCEPRAKSTKPATTPTEITQARAIEIARAEIQLTTAAVEAVRATSQGRAIWRITFQHRQPDALPGLFDTHIVEVDARTGEIVGVFKS
jgi:hypothetical protein